MQTKTPPSDGFAS